MSVRDRIAAALRHTPLRLYAPIVRVTAGDQYQIAEVAVTFFGRSWTYGSGLSLHPTDGDIGYFIHRLEQAAHEHIHALYQQGKLR